MWNATIGNTNAFFLAALVVATAGCDSRVAAPQAPQAVGASLLDPSDTGRQRDDLARGRVWILNSQSVFLYHTSTARIVEVTLPSWQWVDTPYACPPDLAVGPNGEAVVTSNVVPVLWRIDPKTLAVTTHKLVLDTDKDKDVGFSRLEYSNEQGTFIAVSDVHGSVWRIDLSMREARKIALSEPMRKACRLTVPHGE